MCFLCYLSPSSDLKEQKQRKVELQIGINKRLAQPALKKTPGNCQLSSYLARTTCSIVLTVGSTWSQNAALSIWSRMGSPQTYLVAWENRSSGVKSWLPEQQLLNVAELNDDPASLATLFQNTELGRVLRIFVFCVRPYWVILKDALLQSQGTAISW